VITVHTSVLYEAGNVLTLSGHKLIYNQQCDSASMDEGRYMTDSVSFAFHGSYINCILLLVTVFRANAFMNVFSAILCHLEVII
jgi:hypothetical protein